MYSHRTASHLVETAVEALEAEGGDFASVLEDVPAAIYVTDPAGTVTYYNPACIPFAGRTPQIGEDKWCVTWKLFTTEGQYLPHEQCPMAIAIRDRKPVRDVEAVAERPDGSRVSFVPFPTPLFDSDGQFRGALNLLMDVTEQRKPEYLRAQGEKCRRLARASIDTELIAMLNSMAERYEQLAAR